MYLEQSVDDAELVKRSLEGDTAAFEALVTHYQRVLFTVAVRMLGDREDARDATQNTFIKVYQKLNTYDPQYPVLQLGLPHFEERVPERSTAAGDRSSHRGTRARGGPQGGVGEAQRHRDVRAALLTLPEAYREVIVLRHFAGLSYEEMGAAIGVPAKTVKSRLYTARHQLAQLLDGWSNRDDR